jgi:hypothetical protein
MNTGAADCRDCWETCLNYCFKNVEKMCLSGACGKTVMTAVGEAQKQSNVASKTLNPASSTNEGIRNVAKLAEMSNIALDKLASVQKSQLEQWTSTFISKSSRGDAFCSDNALIASDRVVVAQGGVTHISALISCTSNYFSTARISSTVAKNLDYKSDFTCGSAQSCPVNLNEEAAKRAQAMWTEFANRYEEAKE